MGIIEKLLCRFIPHFDITKKVPGPCTNCNEYGLVDVNPGVDFTCPLCGGTRTTEQEVLYLRRFFLYRGKKFNLFLHHIVRSDDDPDPHDHPFDFTSIILKGGYTDESWEFDYHEVAPSWFTEEGGKHKRPANEKYLVAGERIGPVMETVPVFSIVQRKASHIHRVIVEPGKTSWSLVLASGFYRPWHFFREGQRVFWREYLNVWETSDDRD